MSSSARFNASQLGRRVIDRMIAAEQPMKHAA
jgi:hypothetical protein